MDKCKIQKCPKIFRFDESDPNCFYSEYTPYGVYCRDELLGYFKSGIKKDFKFLYYILNESSEYVHPRSREFFDKFNKKSKIPVRHRIEVLKTDYDKVLCFRLNKFWHSKIRFSLITALIRCSCNYTGNLKKALMYKDYFDYGAGQALNRFMAGNHLIRYQDMCGDSVYNYGFDGWRSYFSSKDINQIKRILVKRK